MTKSKQRWQHAQEIATNITNIKDLIRSFEKEGYDLVCTIPIIRDRYMLFFKRPYEPEKESQGEMKGQFDEFCKCKTVEYTTSTGLDIYCDKCKKPLSDEDCNSVDITKMKD